MTRQQRQPSGRPLLLGHRGASKYAPENTVEAFDLCLAHGCDGFEFDVRVTADGVGIVAHDPHYRGREILASKAVDLEQCSTLAAIVNAYASKAFLNVELKVVGAEHAIIEFAKRYEAKKILVSSFLPEVLRTMHEISPAMELGLIAGTRKQLAEWRNLPVTAVIMKRTLITRELVDEIHNAGKQAWSWTVNKEQQMREFAGYGIDAIISDDTALLRRVILG